MNSGLRRGAQGTRPVQVEAGQKDNGTVFKNLRDVKRGDLDREKHGHHIVSIFKIDTRASGPFFRKRAFHSFCQI